MKTITKITIATFLSVAVFSVFTTQIQAATIMQEEFFSGTPNFDPVMTFNEFDTSLGTLNSVTVKLTLTITGGDLEVDNDGVAPATVNVSLGADGSLTSSDVAFFPSLSTTTANTATFNLAANDGDGAGVQNLGPDYAILIGTTNTNMNSDTLTHPLILDEYKGTGTFDINGDINTNLDFGGIGGVAGSFNPIGVTGSVKITYDYDSIAPVPEPSAYALVIAGIGLLTLRNRRRSR